MSKQSVAQVVVGLAFLTVIGACGGQATAGREIEVVARDLAAGEMAFEPARIAVGLGEKVTFAIKNEGTQDHEFESAEAGIEEIVVPAGRTRKVSWQGPTRPGPLPAYCDLPGHREAGMELVLAVE